MGKDGECWEGMGCGDETVHNGIERVGLINSLKVEKKNTQKIGDMFLVFLFNSAIRIVIIIK